MVTMTGLMAKLGKEVRKAYIAGGLLCVKTSVSDTQVFELSCPIDKPVSGLYKFSEYSQDWDFAAKGLLAIQ